MKTAIQLVIPNQLPAINHAAKVFFEDVCGLSLIIVSDFNVDNSLITLGYCADNTSNYPNIKPCSFLEIDNELTSIEMVDVDGILFPFACSSDSLMPFDPIALTWFLMLMPHEQMRKCDFDHHHRPISQNTWLVKKNLHHLPLIDIAANVFFSALKLQFPEMKFPTRTPFFEPTFDIDIAFAHKAKSIAIHGLGTLALALKGDVGEIKNRINVWRNTEIDPYDVFDELLDALEEQNLKAVFFAMTANRSKHDRNNHYRSIEYRKLLKRLSEKHTVGIHPGYIAAENSQKFALEKKRLEDILEKDVTHVRQHFLRQFIPEMWQTYIENGLSHDYSIGYATHDGYKVGTCMPYQAYDVALEKVLPITIHPFALMDTALWRYQKSTSEQMLEATRQIKIHQKKYLSPISAVWHNYAMPYQSVELEVFKKQILIFGHND